MVTPEQPQKNKKQPWKIAYKTATTTDKNLHGQAEKSINSYHHEHLARRKSFSVAATQASKYLYKS